MARTPTPEQVSDMLNGMQADLDAGRDPLKGCNQERGRHVWLLKRLGPVAADAVCLCGQRTYGDRAQ